MQSTTKARLLVLSLVSFLLFFMSSMSNAATYYISPTGSDANTGASTSPWASFNHAMTNLQAGDELVLQDGTFKQSLTVTASGEEGNPILIRAENDGGAFVDGEFSKTPLRIGTGIHDIVIEGISFRNSDDYVVDVSNASRIVLRRITAAHTGSSTGNYHQVQMVRSNDVLVEDVAAFGLGRTVFLAYESTDITFRRCFAYWQDYETTPYVLINIYGSGSSTVENCIGTMAPNANHKGNGVYGVGAWMNTQNEELSSNNQFLGNVIYGTNAPAFWTTTAEALIENNQFHNNVAIGVGENSETQWWATYQRGGKDMLFNQMTVAGFPEGRGFVFEEDGDTNRYDDIDATSGEMKNSIFTGNLYGLYALDSDGSLDNHHNNFHNMQASAYTLDAEAGEGEISLDPMFDVLTYGKGAFLFIPDGSPLQTAGENGARMGADVLYRYVDGQLTDEPLWPWAMEDRIMSELGVSVTWEANGGLWKTLEGVYSDNPEPELYTLTVNQGAGDGNYQAGSTVAITADTPAAGMVFDQWTGDNLAAISDIMQANTSLTMPSNAMTITATYRNSDPERYTLTVNQGSGDGDYQAGANVSIVADAAPDGKIFDQWIGDTASIADTTESATSLIMPAQAISITATYRDDEPDVEQADLSVTLYASRSRASTARPYQLFGQVSNAGADTANNVVLDVNLPDSLSLRSSNTCAYNGEKLQCVLGDISANQAANYDILLNVESIGSHTVSVTANTDTDDTDLSNNSTAYNIVVRR